MTRVILQRVPCRIFRRVQIGRRQNLPKLMRLTRRPAPPLAPTASGTSSSSCGTSSPCAARPPPRSEPPLCPRAPRSAPSPRAAPSRCAAPPPPHAAPPRRAAPPLSAAPRPPPLNFLWRIPLHASGRPTATGKRSRADAFMGRDVARAAARRSRGASRRCMQATCLSRTAATHHMAGGDSSRWTASPRPPSRPPRGTVSSCPQARTSRWTASPRSPSRLSRRAASPRPVRYGDNSE